MVNKRLKVRKVLEGGSKSDKKCVILYLNSPIGLAHKLNQFSKWPNFGEFEGMYEVRSFLVKITPL